jgi:pyruvate,orthophosphate dikinase
MLGFAAAASASYPEITEMQARAIFEAAAQVQRKASRSTRVMIPLVGHVKELALQAAIVRRVAAEVAQEGGKIAYSVGTMIECRAAPSPPIRSPPRARFFSFGTNDLTQTALGVSRDDAGRFLVPYVGDFEIYPRDPFQTIDEDVGTLIRIAVERGRKTRRR